MTKTVTALTHPLGRRPQITVDIRRPRCSRLSNMRFDEPSDAAPPSLLKEARCGGSCAGILSLLKRAWFVALAVSLACGSAAVGARESSSAAILSLLKRVWSAAREPPEILKAFIALTVSDRFLFAALAVSDMCFFVALAVSLAV